MRAPGTVRIGKSRNGTSPISWRSSGAWTHREARVLILSFGLGQIHERRLFMSLRINDVAPDFTADSTEGTINFHQWIGDGWAILFSHPKDFTPVCTNALRYMARIKPEFDKRNTKILGISVDGVSNHQKWSKDIETSQGHAVNYP